MFEMMLKIPFCFQFKKGDYLNHILVPFDSGIRGYFIQKQGCTHWPLIVSLYNSDYRIDPLTTKQKLPYVHSIFSLWYVSSLILIYL